MANKNDNLPIYLFHEGKNFQAFDFFSPTRQENSWVFRVWAPNAAAVSLVGDFNYWDRYSCPMHKISDGIWECETTANQYDTYKFCITSQSGRQVLKSDPYASHAETAPANASKIFDISGYKWGDDKWKKTAGVSHLDKPMNIYEVHAGSWRRHHDGNPYGYRQLADALVPYLKEMNYTHVELMPITEFPYDGSWGYQVTGLFAPTSRFGTPHDFMYFVDACHKAGIGVLLDWVVAHFPKDEHGLYEFDGSPQYESGDYMMNEHKEWGTRIFDYGRNEVRSFLISSAMFWIEKYHIDGIRVDAVASMLYLDYARKSGEWRANKYGGNYNLEAIDFLKELNYSVLTRHPNAIMIAEESTAFPMVTMPTEYGGLGFNYKWNMGWMNDVLSYCSLNPFYRKYNHGKLINTLSFAFSENYVLPLSHDEVVHGKGSLISKVPGYYEDKFRALKALYGYMIAHPGKKLFFMGGEFGQFIEWKYSKELDWMLLHYDAHIQLKNFVKALNKYYLKNKEMYEQDNTMDGFRWLVVDDKDQNVISFVRYAKDGTHTIAVMNFSPMMRCNYNMGVPEDKTYSVQLTSNDVKFGGYDDGLAKYTAYQGGMHGCNQHITMDIPPDSVIFLK